MLRLRQAAAACAQRVRKRSPHGKASKEKSSKHKENRRVSVKIALYEMTDR